MPPTSTPEARRSGSPFACSRLTIPGSDTVIDRRGLPPTIDTKVPSIARVYDYLLGGDHNFQVDRVLAEAALTTHPGIAVIARENRSVMRRAIRYAIGRGITQFL